jgi:acetoin utilization protein AcuB
MTVKDIMTTGPITVPPDMAVLDARQLMFKHRIRHLPVTDGRRLLGIVTDRDIRLNLPSPATSLSVWELNYLLAQLTVDSVMTHTVIAVDPERPAAEAARIMLDHKIGALPVLDGGVIVGIVTESDMLRAVSTIGGGPAAAVAG